MRKFQFYNLIILTVINEIIDFFSLSELLNYAINIIFLFPICFTDFISYSQIKTPKFEFAQPKF